MAAIHSVCAAAPEAPRANRSESRDPGAVDLHLSGEHRIRYESLDPQFRPLLGAADEVLALRTSLRLDAAWPKWRLVGEILDSRAELNDSESLLDTGVVNTFEPVQLSISRSWTGVLEEGAVASINVGRLTVDLGSRRLMARNLFRNTANSFVGAEWRWVDPENRAFRAFYLRPAQIRPDRPDDLLSNAPELDAVARRTRIRGIYYGQPIERLGGEAEVYWLNVDASVAMDPKDLTTIGARVQRTPDVVGWHYELEIARQTGRSSDPAVSSASRHLKHHAHFWHVDLGYTFPRRTMPTVSVLLDEASGDENPEDAMNQRFDTLYGARRFELGPSGIYGPFARSNLETPGIRLALAPAKSWRSTLTYRSFKLASARDAWTTTQLRDPTGRAGDELGQQLELQFSWHPSLDWLSLEFGAAHFRKGEFIRHTAPELAEASRYFYIATTMTFERH